MRKRTVQLRRENKVRIHPSRLAAPDPCQFRFDVAVKRCIDLDHVEEPGHVLKRMDLLPLHSWWIKDSFPVLIRPPGRADADLAISSHRKEINIQRTPPLPCNCFQVSTLPHNSRLAAHRPVPCYRHHKLR